MTDRTAAILARLEMVEGIARTAAELAAQIRADLQATPEPVLVTPKQAAAEMGVDERTVTRWLARCPAAGTKRGGRWLVSLTSLREAVSDLPFSPG